MKSDNVSPANSEQDIVVGYRSRTLLVYGKIVSAVGWLVLVAGLVIFMISSGMIEHVNAHPIMTPISLLMILIGIAMIVSGQLISCFVSIEKNTRYTYELLKQK